MSSEVPKQVTGVLELYCGLGGAAAALAPAVAEGAARTVGALDLHPVALEVYRANFPDAPARAANLVSFDPALWPADLWWLSPPCQPYTRRGLGRDLDDPRSRSFVALVGRLEHLRPPAVALENVPGFAGSRGHDLLRETLHRAGYRVRERQLCPTDLGLPARRRRFYLVASRGELAPETPLPPPRRRTLDEILTGLEESDEESGGESGGASGADRDPALRVPPELVRRYRHALHEVDRSDPEARTACFTAAYGRSPVRSGSYLRLAPGDAGLRRFSPREILALLGFPPGFRLPRAMPPERAWPLVGNSLAVEAVREVLAALPALRPSLERWRRSTAEEGAARPRKAG